MKERKFLFVDGNHQRIGGVERLNTEAIEGLFEGSSVRRCDLGAAVRGVMEEDAVVVLVDLPLAWGRIWDMVLLRILCSVKGNRASLILREHNYSRSFEREAVRNRNRFGCLLRIGYALVDKVIFVSQAQAAWARERRLCHPGKASVLEHAVEIQNLLGLPEVLRSKEIVFGALGRMTFQKGFDVLLDAWRKAGFGGRARLMIGGDESENEKHRQLAGTDESVEFVGPVSDRRAFYQACDCVVIPSRWEPYGQVCLEARAAGRPVIVSDVDGLPEQVNEGIDGVVFRGGDASDLALKMEELSEITRDPARFRRMGQAGRASAVQARKRFLHDFPALFAGRPDAYRQVSAPWE